MKKIVAILMAIVLALFFVGCKEPDKLVSGKIVKRAEVVDISEQNVVVMDFAVRLLQSAFTGEENMLLSPVSVLSGLSLIANGTEGESLAQIEEVVGMSAEELNEYLYSYKYHLSENWNMDNKLHIANSLWINKDKNITVSDEYLKKNETYHDASIFYTAFDQSCVDDTNKWISDQTDGMVSEIMNEISEDASMYLANSLIYEGVWPEKVYSNKENDFSLSFDNISSGNEELTIMHEREHFYLDDISANGFMKYFEHGKYAFVALVPDEDMDIQTYVQGLSGRRLQKILSNPDYKEHEVGVWMPQFSFDYETDMAYVLMDMGIRDIFEEKVADFSSVGLGEDVEELYINQFIYSTSISVDENGMNTDIKVSPSQYSYAESIGPWYSVAVNRPFMIAVIDCEYNVPLLFGVVTNI